VLPHTIHAGGFATLLLFVVGGWRAGGRAWVLVRGGLLVLSHLLLILPVPVEWQGFAAYAILLLPGGVLVWRGFRATEPPLPRFFLSICGGICGAVIVLLLLHTLPGPLPAWLLVLVCDGLLLTSLLIPNPEREFHHKGTEYTKGNPFAKSLCPLCLCGFFKRSDEYGIIPSGPTASTSPLSPPLAPLLPVLLIGGVLRVLFLGNAEFQGDESQPMLLAMGVLSGQDDILFWHRKGPVEALLPAGAMVASNTVNEWVARLPFALAGMAVLVGGYLLAWRLASHTGLLSSHRQSDKSYPIRHASLVTSVIAASILALDGFLIAFSRIVQYQSIVVLMAVGAVWCGWRFAEGVPHPRRYLAGIVLLATVGMLAHYDGIYVVPTLAGLVIAGARLRQWGVDLVLRRLAAPLAGGILLLLWFYLPFVLHENFGNTLAYVLTRSTMQQTTPVFLFNRLPHYYQLATFYNTTFQVYWLALIPGGALLVWLLAWVRPRPLAWSLAGVFLGGIVVSVWRPTLLQLPGGNNLSIIAFGLPLAALVLARATPAPLRVALAWFSVPMLALAFLISDPKTHFYTLHCAAALLAALALVQLSRWLWGRRGAWLQVLVLMGSGLVVLLALPYMLILFVQQVPEYQRTFPDARPDLYRASYGDELPYGGFFGFPHRDGWKVIGMLYHQGILQGSYTSNQKREIIGWYTRGLAFRCEHEPRYWFLARAEEQWEPVPPGYHLLGDVLVDGQKQIAIYSREPLTQPYQIYDLSEYREPFDTQPLSPFPLHRALKKRGRLVPQQNLTTPQNYGTMRQ
jgi:hypothetical protein